MTTRIVRVVPRVEREEFVNVGVIVSCPSRGFSPRASSWTSSACSRSTARVDLAVVRKHLASIPTICAGGPDAGPIGPLSQRERFHWLVAPRSTIIQTSRVHYRPMHRAVGPPRAPSRRDGAADHDERLVETFRLERALPARSGTRASRGHRGARKCARSCRRKRCTDWAAFADSWNDLGVDAYMADNGRYRRRRFGAFAIGDAGATPSRWQPRAPSFASRISRTTRAATTTR